MSEDIQNRFKELGRQSDASYHLLTGKRIILIDFKHNIFYQSSPFL